MKTKLTSLLCTLSIVAAAQTSNFYGLARKIGSPNKVYFSSINPTTGVVSNVSTSSLSERVNLSGAALNPYENHYYFIAQDSIKTVDISSGNLVRSVKIDNPIAGTTFENFRFNNSDSLLYGLAKETIMDSSSSPDSASAMTYIYFASINPVTGLINKISPKSISLSYDISGNAIDPYQKLYYFSTGKGIANFVSIDMYTGEIYTDQSIKTSKNQIFELFTYSCTDTTIYGLLRENYYSYSPSPIDTSIMIENLDSTSFHLAKIEPKLGTITKLSPYSLGNFSINFNASVTIDPDNKIYYFATNTDLIGVSLNTGLQVSKSTISNTDGDFFYLMRIASHCEEATTPIRLSSPTSILTKATTSTTFNIFPNPANSAFSITAQNDIERIKVTDLAGRLIFNKQMGLGKKADVDIQNWPNGLYLISVQTAQKIEILKFEKR